MSFAETHATLEHRTATGVYGSYPEAQRAVDLLSDEGFPVEQVAIVGTGLRYVEQVEGRLTTGRAALAGAGQGLFIGLVLALLFGLFFTTVSAFLAVLLYGLVAGAVIGAIFGALWHAASGGQRDFTSVPAMTAERYEVMTDVEVADRAREILNAKLSPRPPDGR